MHKWVAVGVVSFGVLMGGGIRVRAQNPRVLPSPRVAPVNPEPESAMVISGGDFGFRVERWDGGTPVGRIVVRHDGKWVEVRIPVQPQRLTTK